MPGPCTQAAGKKRVLLTMAGPLCGRFDTSSALSRVAARAASARSSAARAPRHATLEASTYSCMVCSRGVVRSANEMCRRLTSD